MFYVFLFIAISAILAWIKTVIARRRMARALGREVTSRETMSINTWIAVDKAEKKKNT